MNRLNISLTQDEWKTVRSGEKFHYSPMAFSPPISKDEGDQVVLGLIGDMEVSLDQECRLKDLDENHWYLAQITIDGKEHNTFLNEVNNLSEPNEIINALEEFTLRDAMEIPEVIQTLFDQYKDQINAPQSPQEYIQYTQDASQTFLKEILDSFPKERDLKKSVQDVLNFLGIDVVSQEGSWFFTGEKNGRLWEMRMDLIMEERAVSLAARLPIEQNEALLSRLFGALNQLNKEQRFGCFVLDDDGSQTYIIYKESCIIGVPFQKDGLQFILDNLIARSCKQMLAMAGLIDQLKKD